MEKKYKLQKTSNNLIAKNINIIHKKRKLNNKLFYPSFILYLTSGVFYTLSDEYLFLLLEYIGMGLVVTDGILALDHVRKVKTAYNKLEKLQNALREKGIDAYLLGEFEWETIPGDNELCEIGTLNELGTLRRMDKIIYYDGQYSYFDDSKNTEYIITEEVNEYLLKKRLKNK